MREAETQGPEAQSPPPSPPSTGFKRGVGILLKLLLTGVVTWFILRAVGLNLHELRSFDLGSMTPRWGLLALSSAILLLGYLYSAGLWGLMVREMSGVEVPPSAALRVFFTANLGRYLPGKVWQMAGLAYLAKGEGVTASAATAAALLGQLLSLAGATLIGSGVLLDSEAWNSAWKSMEGPLGGVVAGRWALGGILGILLLLTLPVVLKPLVRRLMARMPGAVPASDWPDRAFGLRWLGLYAIAWILQGGAFWVLVLGMGMELDPLYGVAVFPAAYLAGYIAIFAPAGLGIREGVLIVFLSPTLGAGAGLVALVARLWTTVIELVPALLLGAGYLKGPRTGQGEEGSSA